MRSQHGDHSGFTSTSKHLGRQIQLTLEDLVLASLHEDSEPRLSIFQRMRQKIKTSIFFEETSLCFIASKTSLLELCASRQHQILEDIWFPQGHLNSTENSSNILIKLWRFSTTSRLRQNIFNKDKTTLASFISLNENFKSTFFLKTSLQILQWWTKYGEGF